MESILGLAATLVGVFAFIYAFTLIVLSARLVKLQYWEPLAAPVPRADAGDELPYLDAARAVLEQLGFAWLQTSRVRSLSASHTMPAQHIDVYHHPALDLRAEVLAASLPTPDMPYSIFLWNIFSDGTGLLTVNGLAHAMIHYPASITIADAFARDFPSQLAHHLAQRERLAKVHAAPEALSAFFAQLTSTLLPQMAAEGKAYIRGSLDGEAVYGIRLLTAIKAAWRLKAGMRKSKGLAQPADPTIAPTVTQAAATYAADRRAFVQNLSALNDLRAPRWFRWSAFVASAAAFVLVGSWWWGSSVALLIAAVVAVHEAGHWLAMRLAGFRDVQVFFVPGMGAATSGEKNDASPLTHLAVFLAGPVPGLLFALGAFAWLMLAQVDRGAWWYDELTTVIFAAFLINMLNLLPVMPLDGGRVIDLFVMGRLPWFRFLFALASGAGLLYAGFATDDKVLTGLGLVMLIALPHHYRMARLSRALLRNRVTPPSAAEPFAQSAARLFDFMARPAYARWPLAVKVTIGQSILPRFLGRLPGVKETLLGLFIYVACIVVPVVVVAGLAVRDPVRFSTFSPFGKKKEAPDWKAHAANMQHQNDARLAAANGPAQRIKLRAALIDDAHEEFDAQEVLRLARMQYAETATLAAPSREHAEAALGMASALDMAEEGEWRNESARLIKEAEAIARARLGRQDSSDDAFVLARALEARAPSINAKINIALTAEVVDLYAAHSQPAGDRLIVARTALARVLDEAGQNADAERQFELAQADGKRLTGVAVSYAIDRLALDHAWFLMASLRPDDALQRLEHYSTKPRRAVTAWYAPDRNIDLLAAVAARSRGDWQKVKSEMVPIHLFKNEEAGNWFSRLVRPRTAHQRFDLHAGLLLVDAERHLGNAVAADKLVAAMRDQYDRGSNGKHTCYLGNQEDDAWRKQLKAAVSEIEKREFGCEDPPPALMCPVPAPAPPP